MILSMFREEPRADGTPGPVSIRRILAFLLAMAAIGLFVGGFFFEKEKTWYSYLPGIACLCGSLLLLFFTTWADIMEIVKSVRGK